MCDAKCNTYQGEVPLMAVGYEAKTSFPDDPWRGRSTGMRCNTCVWFVCKETGIRKDDGRGSVGRCRRNAPTINGFPVVFTTDWCGNHRLDENKI